MSKIRINTLLTQIPTSQTLTLGGICALVGILSAAGVWIFKRLIDLVQTLMFTDVGKAVSPLGIWSILLIPVAGGLVVGLISKYLIREERFRGVAGVMESVALAGGRLSYKTVPFKAIGAAISIGSGAAVGPEDPSVQIGANLGSFFGQAFRQSDERIRTLVAAGSAAAIAAAFNAPIAGVFFALEIILGEISGSALGMVLVASVVSAVFTQAVSGSEPAFHIPVYAFKSIWELPFYLVLGILAGPLSAGYVRLIYLMQKWFKRWKTNDWIKPASAGLVIGVVGIFLPHVFGVGYGTISEILNQNDFSLVFLIILLLAKLIMTPLCVGSGFMGGVFAPALFLGAALGGAFGMVSSALFPGLSITAPAFALVGMAAVLAGAVHAPLTAILLLFEMTNDYRIILPLMFAVAVSMLLSQRLQRDSVYTFGLAQHGIRLDRGREVEVLQTITVGEVMEKCSLTIVDTDLIEVADRILNQTHSHGLPVLNTTGDLIGILTLQDIKKAEADKYNTTKVGEVCSRELEVAYPGEPLSSALLRMSRNDLGRLPVVDRNYPRRLVGMLHRSDVIHAYEIAVDRRTSERHLAQKIRLDAVTPNRVDVNDFFVEKGALCAGKKIAEIPWPPDTLIASIQRGNQVFIPHGETLIQPGDILVVVAKGQMRQTIQNLCERRNLL